MSKLTTQHCKDFLNSVHPDVSADGWKRVRKFNDDQGQSVREFSHAQMSGNVFVLESSGALSVIAAPIQLVSAPAKYVYCVIDDDHEDDTDEFKNHKLNNHIVSTTKMSHWKKHGDIDDESESRADRLFPQSWSSTDLGYGTWLISCSLDETQLIEKLETIGFASDASYDALMSELNGRSAQSPAFAAYMAQKQNAIIQAQVAPQTAIAPSAGKPKI